MKILIHGDSWGAGCWGWKSEESSTTYDPIIKLGNIKVANIIALGCLIANKNIIKPMYITP